MYITFVFVSYLDIKPPGIWLSPSQSPLRIQWEVFFWLPSPSTCFWLAFKTYDTDYTDDLGEKVGLLSCWFLRFQPKHFQRQQIRLQKLRFVFRRAYRHRGRSKPPNTTYMKIESHLLNKNQRIKISGADFSLTLARIPSRFRRQELCFRVSHLPQLLYAGMFCYPTYTCHWYTKTIFVSYFNWILI